jgi:hypothetical protein
MTRALAANLAAVALAVAPENGDADMQEYRERLRALGGCPRS